ETVRDAAARGLTVKPVGSGHSFTPVAVTDGVQIRMGNLARLRGADPATGLVTVEAGDGLWRRTGRAGPRPRAGAGRRKPGQLPRRRAPRPVRGGPYLPRHHRRDHRRDV